MNLSAEELDLLRQAEKRLHRLSPERLRVANDFLAYLQEREENEATEELMGIPGFEGELREAIREADAGEVVSFDAIRRDV
jgi:hypothetical protein